MEIINDNALLVRVRNPQLITQAIPKSRQVDEHQVLVHWSLDTVKVLKNLGLKRIPSPIVKRYEFCGKFTPFQHQVTTADFLTLHKRAFCFNDAGTGKSASALWAADYLMTLNKVRRVLIVGPLSILYDAWFNGVQSTIMHRSAVVAHSSQSAKRIAAIKGDYEIVIVNYDGLPMLAEHIIADGRFDLIIADEATALKNAQTRRWKTFVKLLRPDMYVWLMTGTPASQSPEDAYGLARIINPSGVPMHMGKWRDMVMNKVTQFKWAPKPDAKQRVFTALQPAIRFTKDECLDLPPVITVTRTVALTPQQKMYYQKLKTSMQVTTSNSTITAVHAAAAISKLLQISSGASYDDGGDVVEFDCSPRLNVLLEVLQETDRKVIVFAPFTHSIETILWFFTENKVLAKRIDGSVNLKQRQKVIDEFQRDPELRVLVIQPQAAAHGITLTAADTVVFYGPVTSVELYVQCIARADRAGQTSKNVTVVHIQSSEVEQKMFKILAGRVEAHNAIVDLYKDLAK